MDLISDRICMYSSKFQQNHVFYVIQPKHVKPKTIPFLSNVKCILNRTKLTMECFTKKKRDTFRKGHVKVFLLKAYYLNNFVLCVWSGLVWSTAIGINYLWNVSWDRIISMIFNSISLSLQLYLPLPLSA